MQRHIPLGYCVVQGKAQIDPETCQVVQNIYQAYDNLMTMGHPAMPLLRI
nr:hypothetical protein [uncultured Anaerotignum sp.]